MNKVIKIRGLDCANCARELEEELVKIEGVISAHVDFMGERVYFEGEDDALGAVVNCCNNFEEVKVIDFPEGDKQISDADSSHNCSQSGACAPADGDKRAEEGRKIKIENLCCANCGRELEEILNGIEGVEATVDFMNMTIVLKTADTQCYEKAVYEISHFEDVRIVDGKPAKVGLLKEHIKSIISIIVGGVFFIPALILDLLNLGFAPDICAYVFYCVAYVAAGWQVILTTGKNLSKGRIFDENFLMTIASLGAIGLGIATGDGYMEGAAVMLLYQIGELLQSIAVGSSRRSISELMDLKSETATLLKDGGQVVVAPEDLKVGDTILIKAGEKVPVDCTITKGATSLDTKSLTGEAAPRDVQAGDEMLSGSININAVIEARVERAYENSAVSKILDLVENSTAKKAKSEKFITKFAKYYTPSVVIAAVLIATIVPTAICAAGGAFGWGVYSGWIYKALSLLVISCPCALVISVPLTYFGGIGRCAKSGILVKGSTSLDSLAAAKIAAFDKTGTLTEGSFAVADFSSERALKLAACAEKYSSHPIAAAFTAVATEYEAADAEEIAGRGVRCTVDGKILLCGNAAFLEEAGVDFTPTESVSTLVYVALDGQYVGVIEIDDRIKEDAPQAIAQLKKQGVERTVMLTGDSEARAASVAGKVGVDEYKAALLPDGKLDEAAKLKESGALIYVGDGINDAPVMTVADCAVSMGKVGSDAAIEASDIVLVSDNLSILPEAKKVAKRTRSIVFQNIIGSLIVKFGIMALDVAIATFPMIIAIFADVGVMLLAVLNALRTKLIK